MSKAELVKLNLGAGPSGINGWINLDWGLLPILAKNIWLRSILVKFGWLDKSYETEWPVFKLHDIRKSLPLKDNSVDYVYCSHVLEHFRKFQAFEILKESYRVLKMGGVIRVSVPDIKRIIELYKKDEQADVFCEYIWGYDKGQLSQSYLDKLKGHFIRGHEWAYDEKSMAELLEKAGFKNIKLCKLQEGRVPDLKKLDLKSHQKESLFIEADKSQ